MRAVPPAPGKHRAVNEGVTEQVVRAGHLLARHGSGWHLPPLHSLPCPQAACASHSAVHTAFQVMGDTVHLGRLAGQGLAAPHPVGAHGSAMHAPPEQSLPSPHFLVASHSGWHWAVKSGRRTHSGCVPEQAASAQGSRSQRPPAPWPVLHTSLLHAHWSSRVHSGSQRAVKSDMSTVQVGVKPAHAAA